MDAHWQRRIDRIKQLAGGCNPSQTKIGESRAAIEQGIEQIPGSIGG